jgi:hypothetical protein
VFLLQFCLENSNIAAIIIVYFLSTKTISELVVNDTHLRKQPLASCGVGDHTQKRNSKLDKLISPFPGANIQRFPNLHQV